MNRAQRRLHAMIWPALGPLLLVALIALVLAVRS